MAPNATAKAKNTRDIALKREIGQVITAVYLVSTDKIYKNNEEFMN